MLSHDMQKRKKEKKNQCSQQCKQLIIANGSGGRECKHNLLRWNSTFPHYRQESGGRTLPKAIIDHLYANKQSKKWVQFKKKNECFEVPRRTSIQQNQFTLWRNHFPQLEIMCHTMGCQILIRGKLAKEYPPTPPKKQTGPPRSQISDIISWSSRVNVNNWNDLSPVPSNWSFLKCPGDIAETENCIRMSPSVV